MGKQVSLGQRYEIVALRERNVTFSDIAKQLRLKSKATAKQVYQHYLREGSVYGVYCKKSYGWKHFVHIVYV